VRRYRDNIRSVLEPWVADDPAHSKWIRDHRLVSGGYDERIKELRQALQGSS
jgi:hypothetical protein